MEERLIFGLNIDTYTLSEKFDYHKYWNSIQNVFASEVVRRQYFLENDDGRGERNLERDFYRFTDGLLVSSDDVNNDIKETDTMEVVELLQAHNLEALRDRLGKLLQSLEIQVT
jgi:hypothetical protein